MGLVIKLVVGVMVVVVVLVVAAVVLVAAAVVPAKGDGWQRRWRWQC